MSNEFESIIEAVKKIKLSEGEKARMRAYLLERVPIVKEMEQNQNVTNFKNTRLYYYYQSIRDYYFMSNKYKFAPALIVALIVVLVGGTSAFAEKAIPGDLLYGVKVSINEPVAGVFALTKEEKTKWQERLVERRLDEAQKLVSKGDLNETTRVNLENQIKNKIDEFNVNVNELALKKNEDINSSDLNIRLQASLKAYQNVLENISGEANVNKNTKEETEKFLTTLEGYKNKAENDHKNLELNVGADSQDLSDSTLVPTDSLALAKQKAAENLVSSIKLAYQKEQIHLSTNIQNQISDKLASAETALQEGNSLVVSSDYVNATDKFKTVISLVNTAKLLMLSNVMKADIENKIGVEEESNDIEDDQFEDVEENDINSPALKPIKPHSSEFKSNGISPSEFDIED